MDRGTIELVELASDTPESDSGSPVARQRQSGAAPDAGKGRSYLQTLADERKARLARLGAPSPYQVQINPIVREPKPPKRFRGRPPNAPPVKQLVGEIYSDEWWGWNLIELEPSVPRTKGSYPIKPPNAPTVKDIVRLVCKRYGIGVKEIQSHCKVKRLMKPRQVAMYLCRELSGQSFTVIARELGGRDHSTIIHGANRIAAEILTNPELLGEVCSIRRALR